MRLICSLCQTWRKAWPPRTVIRPIVVFESQTGHYHSSCLQHYWYKELYFLQLG